VNRCPQHLWVLALASGLSLIPVAVWAQSTQQPAPSPAPSSTPSPQVPDAPTPQVAPPLSDVKDQITPGIGSQPVQRPPAPPTTSSSGDADSNGEAAPSRPVPGTQPPSANAPDDFQKTPPQVPEPGTGVDSEKLLIRTFTNFVEVPVTVKDSKGQQVAGLTYRDFRIFENNQRQQISFFTEDAHPLSVAYVIDQSVTSDVMSKVNDSLGAIQGSLAPYDDVAVFAYNNGPKELTGFTGAQSNRLTAILEVNKVSGREEGVPVTSGPLAACGITSNGDCVDPNLQQGRSAGGTQFMALSKEIHTLNDAILRAAVELSKRPVGRRRVIYVISDGKEYGSKATTKEVIKYLETNKIAVYGTLVGDSARWGEGYLSRFHIPFQMNDNILIKYARETGGSLDAENSVNGIEKSYQRIAGEARNQYTLGYISHEYVTDSRYRSIEVRIDRPNVEVKAKAGYYPTAQDIQH